MIAILLTMTDNKKELTEELERWEAVYGHKPALIVGHNSLRGLKYKKIPVLTLSDVWEMHADQLGETDDE